MMPPTKRVSSNLLIYLLIALSARRKIIIGDQHYRFQAPPECFVAAFDNDDLLVEKMTGRVGRRQSMMK